VHIHAHTPAHKHTHALTHAGTHPLNVSVFAQAGFLSLCFSPILATCRGNFSCFVVEMVTCVASWYDCTSKQSRYVQLSVREDSEKSAVRNLIGMVSVGLCVLCLLSVLRHHRYFTGSVSLQKSICTFLMHAFGVERLDVRHVFVEDDVNKNLVSLRKMTISSVAIACRRVGSKRVKSVPAFKNIHFKKKEIFRT